MKRNSKSIFFGSDRTKKEKANIRAETGSTIYVLKLTDHHIFHYIKPLGLNIEKFLNIGTFPNLGHFVMA